MNTAEVEAYEAGRSQAYKLLADCFHNPGVRMFNIVVALDEILKIICPEAATFVTLMKTDLEEDPDLTRLEVDYAKLFVGPFSLSAPPYGSVYLEDERRVMGESTFDVIHRYKDAGLELC